MSRIEVSIDINVPSDKVWDALTDIMLIPEWIEKLSIVSFTEPPRVGGFYTWTYKMAGIFSLEGRTTYTKVEPGVCLEHDNDGSMSSHWEWRLSPQGGATRTTCIIEYTLPGALAGRVVDKLVVEPQNQKDAERGLARLKELTEQSHPFVRNRHPSAPAQATP